MTSSKYLDSLGVSYLWNKIKNYTTNHTYSRATDGSNEIIADDNTHTIQIGGSGAITVALAEDSTSHNAKFTISGSSKTAANGGTDLSLVTTGEKYEWGNKMDKGAYVSSGSLAMFNAVGNVEDSNILHTDVVTLSGSQALTNKTYNGYTLAAASAKGVDTSITAGSTSTNLPTTAAVEARIASAIQAAQSGAAMYQGAAPTTFAPTNYKSGYYWIVRTAGTYVGQTCEPGDMIFANTDSATYNTDHFDVIQTNLDIASMTNSEIDAATDQTPNPS